METTRTCTTNFRSNSIRVTSALLITTREDINLTAVHCTAAAMAARHAYHVRPRDNRRRRPIPGRPPSPSRPMGGAAATDEQPLKSHGTGERATQRMAKPTEPEPPPQSHAPLDICGPIGFFYFVRLSAFCAARLSIRCLLSNYAVADNFAFQAKIGWNNGITPLVVSVVVTPLRRRAAINPSSPPPRSVIDRAACLECLRLRMKCLSCLK